MVLACVVSQTVEALLGDQVPGGVEVRSCGRERLKAEIGDADMAVPLMTRLDADTIALGTRLRLILQFGVGLEGVDAEAATKR